MELTEQKLHFYNLKKIAWSFDEFRLADPDYSIDDINTFLEKHYVWAMQSNECHGEVWYYYCKYSDLEICKRRCVYRCFGCHDFSGIGERVVVNRGGSAQSLMTPLKVVNENGCYVSYFNCIKPVSRNDLFLDIAEAEYEPVIPEFRIT